MEADDRADFYVFLGKVLFHGEDYCDQVFIGENHIDSATHGEQT